MNIILKADKIYSEHDINRLIKANNPNASDVNLKWLLFEMIKKEKITKVGKGHYLANARKYHYEYGSEVSRSLSSWLNSRCPLIKSIVWETRQLNEWTNQLIATNNVVVEIESGFESIIFQELLKDYSKDYFLLLNPNPEMISRYQRNDLIIVKTLFSRSPLSKNDKKITLEKLVVDSLIDKTISSMFDSKDIDEISKGIINNYDIDIDKTLTYAKRRRCEDKLIEIRKEIND